MNIKVKFIKSPTGTFLLAYSAGDVATFPDKQAKALIEAGFAVSDDGKQSNLPDDLPGRTTLAKLGYTTLDAIRKIPDLTELEGIGDKLAQQIKDYLR